MLWDSFKVTCKHIDTALNNFIESGITQSIVFHLPLMIGREKLDSPSLHSKEVLYPLSWHPEIFWQDPECLPGLQGPCWKTSVETLQLDELWSWELGSLYSTYMCVGIYKLDIDIDMILEIGQLFNLRIQKQKRCIASFFLLNVIILTRIFSANTLLLLKVCKDTHVLS